MSGMSFAEMAAVYTSTTKAPLPLTETAVLSGKTTLEKLDKLYYVRQNGLLPKQPASWLPVERSRVIAICLVIVDELYHEDIWKEWLESYSSRSIYRARIFIHAKKPDAIKSDWVRQHTLDITHNPEWNSPEVVRAMLSVLSKALEDPRCGRFVFGTESCVPIEGLHDVGLKLFAEDKSWMNAFHTPKSSWENGACFRSVDASVIPPQAVWKCIPGWMMLNRRHANEVVHLATVATGQDLVQAWGPGGQWSEAKGGVFAPEEVFFPTMLALLGYLRDTPLSRHPPPGLTAPAGSIAAAASTTTTPSPTTNHALTLPDGSKPSSTDEVLRIAVTFAEWAKRGDPNPISYEYMTPELVERFKKSGALFARKFKKGTLPIAVWRKIVLGRRSPEGPKTAIIGVPSSLQNSRSSNCSNNSTTNNNISSIGSNSRSSGSDGDGSACEVGAIDPNCPSISQDVALRVCYADMKFLIEQSNAVLVENGSNKGSLGLLPVLNTAEKTYSTKKEGAEGGAAVAATGAGAGAGTDVALSTHVKLIPASLVVPPRPIININSGSNSSSSSSSSSSKSSVKLGSRGESAYTYVPPRALPKQHASSSSSSTGDEDGELEEGEEEEEEERDGNDDNCRKRKFFENVGDETQRKHMK